MAQQINRELIASCFKTLGIAPTTDYKRIRKAYLVQSKIWHPDRNKLNEASEQTIKINDSYSYLSLYFDHKGLLNDTSGIIKSLSEGTDYNIKENHRSEIKSFLIAFYRGELAFEKTNSIKTFENLIIYTNFFLSLINLIILPPILIWKMGWDGLLLAITMNVLFIFFTMSTFRNLHKIKWLSNLKKR